MYFSKAYKIEKVIEESTRKLLLERKPLYKVKCGLHYRASEKGGPMIIISQLE